MIAFLVLQKVYKNINRISNSWFCFFGK